MPSSWSAARPREHARHRPDRRHDPAHVAHQPGPDEAETACRALAPTASAPATRPTEVRYDLTPVVLENIERLGSRTSSRSAATTRLAMPSAWRARACRWSPSPRRWTTTCRGPSTASASRRRSRGPRSRSTGSARRWAATSGSASSGSSGETAAITAWYAAYVTSTRCVIPEAPFDLDRLADAAGRGPRGQSQPLLAGDRLRGRVVGRRHAAGVRGARRLRPSPPGDVGSTLAEELQQRTGVETVHSDLTYDLRSGDPDALDQMVATTFANIAVDLLADGVQRPHGGDSRRQVRARATARCGAGRAACGREHHVQRARFRPLYGNRLGMPLLLGRALED